MYEKINEPVFVDVKLVSHTLHSASLVFNLA